MVLMKMTLDNCTHSLFGTSKVYADLLVQEYNKNFGVRTACFRAGCITGPNHAGAKLHGFLSFLVKECVRNKTYQIIGYKGKQVRDNIHSKDLTEAFWYFYQIQLIMQCLTLVVENIQLFYIGSNKLFRKKIKYCSKKNS